MEIQRIDADDKEPFSDTHKDEELPQCKIKRNYSCNHCNYFTQNPRFHLTHLRDIHGERIVINKCNLCLYASRHYQKLVRHMKMVHGSTEGITGQSRKRALAEDNTWSQQQKKISITQSLPLISMEESTINFANLSNDLELSRNSLKDIAALYFAENQIENIMTQMEEADAVQLPVEIKGKDSGSSFFDELKKSIINEGNLTCNCGYVSKCFSEYVIHRKSCIRPYENKQDDRVSILNLNSGSTRCQHCRRRCKSSVDLLNHLETCKQATRHLQFESSTFLSDVGSERQELNNDGEGSHTIENRVCTLDKISDLTLSKKVILEDDVNDQCEIVNEDTKQDGDKGTEAALNSVEVTKKITPEEEATSLPLKKVFKCPRCSFWASTASRFHVHIVGHLKKKPFMCSLCSYCSNWRWDITKHIRLKTIRDPSHKSAQVLMNEESGRLNYNKYNKYITLMKVTDEDGDLKLMKSGEMTPNQVASLVGLPNASLKSNNSEDADYKMELNEQKPATNTDADSSGFMHLPFLASAVMNAAIAQQKAQQEQAAIAAIEEVKNSNDLVTDFDMDGYEKKPFYKCRNCHFTHSNRDAVLAHVKVHYQDQLMLYPPASKSNNITSAFNSTNLYMNNVLAAAMCLSQKQLLQEQSSPTKCNNQPSEASASGKALQQAASSKPTMQSAGAIREQGEVSEKKSSSAVIDASSSASLAVRKSGSPTATSIASAASKTSPKSPTTKSDARGVKKSGMLIDVSSTTSFGKGTDDMKVPSPFRCGHCHQESNWKHVIQRHCRLKHSSYIQIEMFDRNSDGRDPVYRPLDLYRSGQSRLQVMKANQTHEQQTHSNNSNNSEQKNIRNELYSQDSSVSSSNSDQDLLLSHLEITRLPRQLNPSSTSKLLKCPSCPYISANKSQLNYHISLHKPNQYKCNLCPYTSTKKQGLSNHVKTHDPPVAVDDESTKSYDDVKPLSVVAVKVISYCPKCPEIFVNSSKMLQQHLKSHGARFDIKCDACDFSTKEGGIMLSHTFVHTSAYQKKEEEQIANGQENSEYPAQKIEQIILPKTGATVLVVAETTKKSFENEVISPSENGVQEKCPYCPFQSLCRKSFQRHLQCHYRVSKRPEKHTCGHCDFSTSSERNFDEHVLIHFQNKKSGIPLGINGRKGEERTPTAINITSDSKVGECNESIQVGVSVNLRHSTRPGAQKDAKKSSLASPLSSQKTILVNPKTGQVIRRN